MGALPGIFGFDQNGDIETNLDAFRDHMAESDDLLSSVFARSFPKLRDGTYLTGDVWTALFDSILSAELIADSASPVAPAVQGSAPATAIPTLVAAGWFLEGVSIEGFRGINNEGKPLELKFKADKINSVSAVNGVGKTSIYDAIRYAISGRLPWLEELPVTDRDGDYYLNRFHGTKIATIKLGLTEASTGQPCEVVVTRDQYGNRTVAATVPWNGDTVLRSLDREFVLLDGATFQNFISAKPQARGRTFAGLLGLSEYSKMRQALASLGHTKAFNNHFNTALTAQKQAHAEKGKLDASDAIRRDYAVLAGQDWIQMSLPETLATCHRALAQIGLLKDLCSGKEFREIDVDACIEAVKAAEGGPMRDRLMQCIRERQDLLTLNVQAPDQDRSRRLAELAMAREEAVSKTAGDVILQLFQAGAKALQLPEWAAKGICPLCDSEVSHDLESHINEKLADFTVLDSATQALALEWNEAGWADLSDLEKLLEKEASARKIASFSDRATKGLISADDAKGLGEWLKDLRVRAIQRDEALAGEQTELEKVLPQSSVEVTKKVEAARRVQESCIKLDDANATLATEAKRAERVDRVKSFIDTASADFAVAETAISRARLAAVGPVFKANFGDMSFFGVTPAVSKRANSEDLQIRLAEFHGLTDLSPQAVLSESYRNAFAIALYLAAASLYGGMPKFIVLET